MTKSPTNDHRSTAAGKQRNHGYNGKDKPEGGRIAEATRDRGAEMIIRQLDVLYFFSTFSVGLISAAIALTYYLESRSKLLGRYLFYHVSFTLLVTTELLLTYIHANLPGLDDRTVRFFEYLVAFLAKYLFMFALPFFIHALLETPRRKQRDVLFALLTLVTFIGQHFTELSADKRLDAYGDLLERIVFALVVFYCLACCALQKPGNPALGRLVRIFLVLSAVFLPGLLYDLFISDDFGIRFYPILYICSSVLFVAHFRKTRSPRSLEGGKDPFALYELSRREREVAHLLLAGKSNPEIGEALHISLSTVKTHVRNIFAKCGVSSRYALLATFGPEKTREDDPLHREKVPDHPKG